MDARFFFVFTCGLAVSGCGLVLDLQPPDPDAGAMDAQVGRRDAQTGECRFNEDCGGDACGVSACVDGRCQTPAPRDCDDGLDCTDDSCDPGRGCVNAPRDEVCAVPAGSECLVARCDRRLGCVVEAIDELCDDGVGCTMDRCRPDGQCRSTPIDAICARDLGGGSVCDPDNVTEPSGCTAIACDEHTDCVGGPCRGAPLCVDGFCESTPLDGAPCDDRDPCTTGDAVCAAGTCDGGPVDYACDDGNDCTLDTCVRISADVAACDSNTVAPSDTPCDDGAPCTEATMCDGVNALCPIGDDRCTGTNPVMCLVESCDLSSGGAGVCTDTSVCLAGEVCAAGGCGCPANFGTCNSGGLACNCDLRSHDCVGDLCVPRDAGAPGLDAGRDGGPAIDAGRPDSGPEAGPGFVDGSATLDADLPDTGGPGTVEAGL